MVEVINALGGTLLQVAPGTDPLEAEIVGSAAVNQMADAGAFSVDGPVGELIARCAAEATPEALAVVLVLAEIMPDPALAGRAARVAAELSSVPDPPAWAPVLGRARIVGCWQTADIFGDQASVLCEFDHGPRSSAPGSHGLMFLVDFNGPGAWLMDAFVTDDCEEARAQMRHAAQASDGLATFERLAPGDAHDVLAAALHATLAARDESDPDQVLDADGEFWDVWALVASRLGTFAGTGGSVGEEPHAPAELEQLVEEFVASSEPSIDEVEDEVLRRWALRFVRFGNETDGRPLRIGPGRVEAMVLEHGDDLADHELEGYVLTLLRWLEWAGTRQGLPEDAIAVLLVEAEAIIESILGVGLDDDEYGDDDDVVDADDDAGLPPAVVERRQFAMPYREAVVDGEHLVGLDPADPDDLMLLVRGEHPEYERIFADPTSDERVDGVNPRLHLTMLTVVITRLWNDEPRGTWRQAKKMLAQGMTRRDILNALVEPVAEEVFAAL
ncbi:MAG: hypothetical protein ACYC1Z_08090, partial [Georgenia sp.]